MVVGAMMVEVIPIEVSYRILTFSTKPVTSVLSFFSVRIPTGLDEDVKVIVGLPVSPKREIGHPMEVVMELFPFRSMVKSIPVSMPFVKFAPSSVRVVPSNDAELS